MTAPDDPTRLGLPIEPTESHPVVDYPPSGDSLAWGLDDGADEPASRWLTPRRITTAAVITGALVVAAAAAVGYAHWHSESPAATAAQSSTAPPSTTHDLKGDDAKFIADMRGYGVPVNEKDPGYLVLWARGGVCGTAQDPSLKTQFAPGLHTINKLIRAVMGNYPDWTRQQATRFTNGAIDQYCPNVRGPSTQEIAAMPPDARYLAMLQDKLGFLPVDDTPVLVAHQICEWKASDWTTGKMADTISAGDLPYDDKLVITETAISVYCP